MRILLTNDDGVGAPGLEALIEALRPHAELVVVAPDRQRSASSLAITLHQPLRVSEVESRDGVRIFQCSGFPTDCAALGIYVLAGERPDLVVSGINDGANLGEDVLHSGTVGAALEASMMGVAAIAISAIRPPTGPVEDFSAAAHLAGRLIEAYAEGLRLPAGVVLNVNVPPLPLSDLQGVVVTRQGRRGYGPDIRETPGENGERVLWIYGEATDPSPCEETDVGATRAGKVSLTPVSHRVTEASALAALEGLGARGLLD